MISDVLYEAAHKIRTCYLGNEIYNTLYKGELRKRIEKLLAEMDAMRKELDASPEGPFPARKENEKLL
jgi:hypothetical protein